MRSLYAFSLLFSASVLAQSEPTDASVPLIDADAGVIDTTARTDARLAELERRLAVAEAKHASEQGALSQAIDWLKHVPSVVSANGVKVTMSGFAQADVQWRQSSEEQLDPSTHEPLNDTRFLVRRARLRPQIEWGFVSGAIEADFNTMSGAQARIIGAEISAHYTPAQAAAPLVMLTMGQFKVPFGFEVPQSDRERLFMERSNVIRALFPGEYDLGLRIAGEWRFIRYSLAWMNGHPIGEKGFALKAPTVPTDVVGRVGVDAHIVPAFRFEAGFSGLAGTGFHAGLAASKDQIVWRDINGDNIAQASELQVLPGQPASPSSSFGHQAVGGDARLTLDVLPFGATVLGGELVWSKNLDRALSPSDPVASGRDLRGLGWHAELTQHLTQWAALGVRYDRYNPDLDALDSRAGQVLPKDQTYTTLAVTAAFLYRPVLRVLAEYQHNTNALGRDAQGLPTTLNDDSVIVRAEVSF